MYENTYDPAMYQFLADISAPWLTSDKPTKVMVGAIVSGVINRSNKPTKPKNKH